MPLNSSLCGRNTAGNGATSANLREVGGAPFVSSQRVNKAIPREK